MIVFRRLGDWILGISIFIFLIILFIIIIFCRFFDWRLSWLLLLVLVVSIFSLIFLWWFLIIWIFININRLLLWWCDNVCRGGKGAGTFNLRGFRLKKDGATLILKPNIESSKE